MLAIREFDPAHATPAEWEAYHRFRRLRAAEDASAAPIPGDAAATRDMATPNPVHERRMLVALDAGEVVGNLAVWWRREGTADYERFARFVHVTGGVLVARRRQGVGRALLSALLPMMEARQATAATFQVLDESSGQFFVAMGAVEKFRALESRLALADVRWSELEGLRRRATGGLQWEVHAGRVPMPRLRILVPLLAQLIADVPMGGLDVPPTPPDLARYEASYRRMDDRGGAHLLVVANAGEEVAAVSEAMWSADTPQSALQTFTGVARGFRGQGLAKAAKARMLELIRMQLPQVEYVTTQNATTNVPMLHVNAALGFKPHRQLMVFQAERSQLARALQA